MSAPVPVGRAEAPAFLAYCAAHRFDHDESFLDGHSLSLFRPGVAEKSVMILDGAGRARAAGSIMLHPPYRETGKARFRILHAESADAADYQAMLEALLPVDRDFRQCFLFLPQGGQPHRPDKARAAAQIVQELGFRVERRSWLLSRALAGPVDTGLLPGLPPGLALEACDHGNPAHVQEWCRVINDAFAGMAGHSTLTPALFAEQRDAAAEFPGGNLLLFAGGQAVGLVAVKRDTDEPSGAQAYLGPVAVVRERQKRGLGRALLRAGLAAAQGRGFTRCALTVNAENENALGLYLDEGFGRDAVYTCWACPNSSPGSWPGSPPRSTG